METRHYSFLYFIVCWLSLNQSEMTLSPGGNLIEKINATTSMSSTVNYNGFKWDSFKAIDGRMFGNPNKCQCCSASLEERSPWWQINLHHQYLIDRIEIFGRMDGSNKEHYSNLSIHIANATFDGKNNLGHKVADLQNVTKKHTIALSPPRLFQNLIIRKKDYHHLTLCEVKLHRSEYPINKFGDKCSNTCHCADEQVCTRAESDDWMQCGMCAPGWKGLSCESKCLSPSYGVNCSSLCNCFNGTQCDHVTGNCDGSLCNPGWQGPSCNSACQKGYYGTKCTQACNDNCADGLCDHINGVCLYGCAGGWKGDFCNQICQQGFYGNSCKQACSDNCMEGLCYHTNGVCSNGCTVGWKGDLCDQECEFGKYGYKCGNECGYCRWNSTCDKVTGVCPNGCNVGYNGETCDQECEFGKYGYKCGNECGYCRWNSTCDKVTGVCPTGCIVGYYGETCDQAAETKRPTTFVVITGYFLAGMVVIWAPIVIVVYFVVKRRHPSVNIRTENRYINLSIPSIVTYGDLQRNDGTVNQQEDLALSTTVTTEYQNAPRIFTLYGIPDSSLQQIPVVEEYEHLGGQNMSTTYELLDSGSGVRPIDEEYENLGERDMLTTYEMLDSGTGVRKDEQRRF